MAQYQLKDSEFGLVIVQTRMNTRYPSFKWKQGVLYFNLPFFIPVDSVPDLIEHDRERIRTCRENDALRTNEVSYAWGQVIECYKCRVRIEKQNRNERVIYYKRFNEHELSIAVPGNVDLADVGIKKWISSALLGIMEHQVELHIFPLARHEAERLGLHPGGFTVGRGLKKLGHCTRSGKEIQLSRALMFMPEHLIMHVIRHELAHITHPNHSREFHALLNQYEGGKEAEHDKELREFRLPLLD